MDAIMTNNELCKIKLCFCFSAVRIKCILNLNKKTIARSYNMSNEKDDGKIQVDG